MPKSQLQKNIDKDKIKYEFMKEGYFNEISLKLTFYEIKMDIYAYNGDLYSISRQYKKYKKLCYIAIDEFEEANVNDDTTTGLFNFNNNTILKNENAYITFCKAIKVNVDHYEGIINKMYEWYKIEIIS